MLYISHKNTEGLSVQIVLSVINMVKFRGKDWVLYKVMVIIEMTGPEQYKHEEHRDGTTQETRFQLHNPVRMSACTWAYKLFPAAQFGKIYLNEQVGLSPLHLPVELRQWNNFLSKKNKTGIQCHHCDLDGTLTPGPKMRRVWSILHWPDTKYTYLEEDQILFTCDSFGAHYPDERLFNDLMESNFETPYKEYFDAIIGSFKPYVLESLDKIKDLPLKVVAPGHGAILRKDIDRYIELYRQWSTPLPVSSSDKPKIVLAYMSIYGFTKMLADNIVDGISSMGDFEIKSCRLIEDKLDDPELMDRVAHNILKLQLLNLIY